MNPRPFHARRLSFVLIPSLFLAALLMSLPVHRGISQADSGEPKTAIGGDSETLFKFAISWLTNGFSTENLIAFLTDGTLPSPTPTATPVESVQPPTPTSTPDGGEPTPTETPTVQGETFDLKDYFILASNSTWHYTGIQGGSTDDDFRWTVEETMQDVGGGIQATRIRTNTDEPTDALNGQVDFWRFDPAGDLYFHGLFLATAIQASVIAVVPPQNIILTDPIRLGGDGLTIGQTVTDTGAGSITATTFLGSVILDATVESTVHYSRFVPNFETPLGTFTDVLRLVVDLRATVGSGSTATEYEIRENTFFLKKGIGMVAQDQQPDPDDAQVQGIDEGSVAGVPIVAN